MNVTEAVVPSLQKDNRHKSKKKRHKDDDTERTKKKSKKNNDHDSDSKKRRDQQEQNDRSSGNKEKIKKKRKIKDLIDNERQQVPTIDDNDRSIENQVPDPSTTTTTGKPSNEKETSATPMDIQTYDSASDSDSDDGDDNDKKKATSTSAATTTATSTTTTTTRPSATTKPKEKNATLTQNRILPTLHYVYDDTVDMKTQIKNRRMANATIKVNRDYYISDSDEESDSDDDDDNPAYPWHEKLTDRTKIKEKIKSGDWKVKLGRFTIDELMRLEKRIKKIGRRENLTLEQLRETILAENFKANSKFWHKIVKVFPDRSLTQIYEHTKGCYHTDAYKGQWTKEEDEKLLELVKIYDNRFSKVAKEMDRTRKSCHDRYRTLTNKPTGRRGWTKDETEKLEKAVKEYMEQHGKVVSWEYIEKTYFQGERNQLQIRKKWDALQHTFKKGDDDDGSSANVVVVRTRKDVTVQAQLMLFEQMQKMGWGSEDAIDYNKVNTDKFKINKETARRTYYRMRDSLSGCEKMKYPEIIERLVTTRRAMVESLAGN